MVRYSATLDNPRNNGFVSAFKAIRDGGEPDQYAQAGYDGLYLLAKAIKRANSTNPAEVREALAKSKYVSVTGSPIRFDERNQATPKLYVAVIKDGRRVIVEDVDNTCHVPKMSGRRRRVMCPEYDGPHREGEEPWPMMYGHEKSDSVLVAAKPANKAVQTAVEQSAGEATAAEPVEPRAETKGN